MADSGRKRLWARRLTSVASALSFGAVAAALIGAVGSGQELWHFRTGFSILRYAFYAAAAGAVIALVGALLARKAEPRLVRRCLAALVVALAFLAFVGSQLRTARAAVPLHDITTNLTDIPGFHRLPVRADNLERVPDLDQPELAALPPLERWKAVHREAYPDLRTVRVPWSVAETIARAEALARERGWEVVTVDTGQGVLEAVETSRFFRFKDNVVVRARPPAQGGSGTIVDMRSISRVGGSDVGVNAKRIRRFLADLKGD